MTNNRKYGIVGDGRAARHFKCYLEARGLPVRHWSRGMEAERGLTPDRALRGSDTVLVLVSDGAIASVISEKLAGVDSTFVHFSGSLTTTLAHAVHPLTSFGSDLYCLEYYERVPFVTPRGDRTFAELFPGFPNPSYQIREEDRPLYHALAVLAGNFTTALWKKLFQDFEERLGLPPEMALPYLEKIAANLAASPGTALTGPFARADATTVRANLAALGDDPFGGVYEAFARVIAPGIMEDLQ